MSFWQSPAVVMAGLGPAIHGASFYMQARTWMPGSTLGMTENMIAERE